MTRKKLARELVREYMSDQLNGREFGVLVWTGRHGSWFFTKNTSAIMTNGGYNAPITDELMKGLWEGATTKSHVVLSLDILLKMIQEKDMWQGKKGAA